MIGWIVGVAAWLVVFVGLLWVAWHKKEGPDY